MIPIVDKPVIQMLAEEAVASGIEEIIIVTGRGKRAIEDHFDTSFELETNLAESGKLELLREVERISGIAKFVYVRQPRPLGDGDAVLRAKELIGDEPFAVMFGDDIVDHDPPALSQMKSAYSEKPGYYIAAQEVSDEEVHKYGIFDYSKDKGRRVKVNDLVEKPSLENAPSNLGIIGKYILEPDIFPALERARDHVSGELRLIDGLHELVESGKKVYGYRFQGNRYDAGSKIGFLKATIDYALKRPDLADSLREHIKSRLKK